MPRRSVLNTRGLSGVTIGGSGGNQSVAVAVLTVVVVAMALVTVWQNVAGVSNTDGSEDAQIIKDRPFKCTNPDCGAVVWKTPAEYKELTKDIPTDPPPKEQPRFTCPECGQKTLMQAVECPNPNCKTVFIIIRDYEHHKLDDKCPKCGLSWLAAQKGKQVGR